MAMSELPPGPWRAWTNRHGVPSMIQDRDGVSVLRTQYSDDGLAVSAEVLRAIEALPELVEAMRKAADDLESDAASPRWRSAFVLRQALALIDRDGEVSEPTEPT